MCKYECVFVCARRSVSFGVHGSRVAGTEYGRCLATHTPSRRVAFRFVAGRDGVGRGGRSLPHHRGAVRFVVVV